MGQPDNQNLLQLHKPALCKRSGGTTSNWSSAGTRYLNVFEQISSSSLDQHSKSGHDKQAIDYLRRIDINFRAFRLRPGRDFGERKLCGVKVPFTAPATARPDGTLKGKFRIPAKTPAGIKAIEFRGKASVA